MTTYTKWKKRKAARKRADSGMSEENQNDVSGNSTPSPNRDRAMSLKNPYQLDSVDRAKSATLISENNY